jgi:hypothetical protein
VNTAERQLSDWLHEGTPEPPKTLTIEDVEAWGSPPRRDSAPRRRWAPALAVLSVLVVVAVIAVLAAGLRGHRSLPAQPSSSTPARPSASPTPPENAADLRLVGADATSAWIVSSTKVAVSADAGGHWSDVVLPTGVPPASIAAITTAPGRGLWLAVAHDLTIDLYRQHYPSTNWSHTALTATKPAGLNLGGAPPGVSITLQAGQVVTVVGTWGLSTAVAFVAPFYSADDGATFVQHPANVSGYWFSLTFRTPQYGVLIGGVSTLSNRIYRTTDGGTSWTPVTIPSLGSGQPMFSTPTIDGTSIELPVTLTNDNGDQQVSIYRSTDDGATFTASSPPLALPAAISAGQVPVAILGRTVWVPAQGRIYESGDSGETWTTIPSPGTPYVIDLIDNSRAIATATDSGCAKGQSECHGYAYLVMTTDNGRHWRPI